MGEQLDGYASEQLSKKLNEILDYCSEISDLDGPVKELVFRFLRVERSK
jgi:hypothetical protein